MTKEQREILRDAIGLVQQGWIQGTFQKTVNGVECRCASGAISDAAIYEFWKDESEVRNLVRAKIQPMGFKEIDQWNDAPGRTRDEVIALLQSVLDADPS